MATRDKESRMASAITKFEGFSLGSRSQRNNNPGNLKFARQFGAIGMDKDGFAIFDSFASGWLALKSQLELAFENRSKFYSNEMTLKEFFRRYAPGRVQNTDAYAKFVALRLGVTSNTRLKDIT